MGCGAHLRDGQRRRSPREKEEREYEDRIIEDDDESPEGEGADEGVQGHCDAEIAR